MSSEVKQVSQGAPPPSGVQAVFDAEAILVKLMHDFIQENGSVSQIQTEMGNEVLSALDSNYDKIESEYKEIEKKKEDDKHWWQKVGNFFKDAGELIDHLVHAAADLVAGDTSGAKAQWQQVEENPELANIIKAVMYAVAAVTVIAGLVSGNFELVAITVVLLAVTQSGLLNKLESHMGSGAEKLIFDIAVVALATALTAGAGGLEVAANEAGEEAGEEAAEEAGEKAAETASDSSKYSVNGLKAAAMGGMGFSSTLGSVNFAQDLMNTFDNNGKSKQKVEEVLEIIQAAIAVVVGIGSGAAALGSGVSDSVGALSDAISNVTPSSLSNLMSENSAWISNLARGLQVGGDAVGGTLQVANGTNQFRIGDIQGEIGKLQGMNTKLSAVLKMSEQSYKNLNQEYTQTMQADEQLTNFSTWWDGAAAAAQELA